MPQRRLEHYFTSLKPFRPRPGRSFLDLPHRVRRLVYEYVLDCDLVVDLNYTNLIVYPHGQYPETRDCRKLDSGCWYELRRSVDVLCQAEVWEMNPEWDEKDYGWSIWNKPWGEIQAMLFVSKDIHRDIEAYVYSTATFRVCLGQPLGLSRLWRLSEHALSHIQTLTIRLDRPMLEIYGHGWSDEPRPPECIDLSKRWGKDILRSWVQTLDLLAGTLKPANLRLNLMFRAKTMDDAEAVLEPMKRLPLLRGCGICAELSNSSCFWKMQRCRWGRNIRWATTRPDTEESEFSLLAQNTIKILTSVERIGSAPFRYLDLPQEIRLAILNYTNLISPDAVQWRPRIAHLRHPPCRLCDDAGEPIMISENERCCNPHQTGYIEDDVATRYACCENCTHDDHSGICYCCHRSAAWSSTCICSQYHRQALFWVSRQVRWDAQAVYYNSNQILVTPYNSRPLRNLDLDDHQEISSGASALSKVEFSLYLASISSHALHHIRHLEWILPHARRNYLMPKTRAWQDYLDTILLMENAMNLTALTLTVDMSQTKCLPIDDSSWAWWEMVVLPFRRLGDAGLKDFFVNLPRYSIDQQRRAHHERDLERAIMGKDYDSKERNKPEERLQVIYKRLMEKYGY